MPAGSKAASEAEKVMRRLAAQVDERRHPRTNATLDQLLDRYLETLDVGRTTQRMYAKYLEKHVRPFIGRLKAGAVDAEALDSLYAELRRCRVHCTDRRGIDPRTPREHACDKRCRAHVPAAVVDDDPPHPLRPAGRVREGLAVAVGGRQSRAERVASGSPAT